MFPKSDPGGAGHGSTYEGCSAALCNPYFGRVLSPPVGKPETMPIPEETCQHDVVLRLWGRAHPLPWLGLTQFPICLPRAPTVPTFPSARAATQCPMLPQGLMAIASCLNTSEPPRTRTEALHRCGSYWREYTQSFPSECSRVVRHESTGSVYLDSITASIGRVVISGPDADVPATSSIIEEVLGGRRHPAQ